MPNVKDLLSFKKDKDAIFAAELLAQSQRKPGQDTTIFDNFGQYIAAVEAQYNSYNNDSSGAEFLVYQVYAELKSIQNLIYQYAMKKHPVQQRDIIIDVTKCLKRLSKFQNTLDDKNIIIKNNPKLFGSWGSEQFITKYTSEPGACEDGKKLLDSKSFDPSDAKAVDGFNESLNSPDYNYYQFREKKNTVNKTYLMTGSEFKTYLGTNNLATPAKTKKNVLFERKYSADPAYTVDNGRIEAVQADIIKNLRNTVLSQFSQQNDSFQKQLESFKKDLILLQFNIQNQNIEGNEKLAHLGQLLTFKNVKESKIAGKQPKYELYYDFNGPYKEPKFLDNLITFIYNVSGVADKIKEGKKVDTKHLDQIFTESDGGGFRDLYIELNKLQKDPMVPDKFKETCKPILTKFENIFKTAVSKTQADPFEKYVAMNTGRLNFAAGEDLVDGVAKVTTAYEWKKKNDRLTDPSKKETFDPAKIDKLAEDMKKDPIFKAYYTSRTDKTKWSTDLLKLATKKHEEWMISNIKENPFAEAERQRKIKALNSLKELGKVIPDADGASDEYKVFNSTLKGLSNKNINNLQEDEMNTLLKDIFDINEKYMKGRKSSRYKDISKEHFEETLDVLKIYSDLNIYGEALAKKLVDRTNYVRTHRWHGMWEQEKVDLSGRSIEATRARIDVLVHGKKPAAAPNADGPKK